MSKMSRTRSVRAPILAPPSRRTPAPRCARSSDRPRLRDSCVSVLAGAIDSSSARPISLSRRVPRAAIPKSASDTKHRTGLLKPQESFSKNRPNGRASYWRFALSHPRPFVR